MSGNPYHDAKGLFTTSAKAMHVVTIHYDDPSGKGRASIHVPVRAKSKAGASAKALDAITRFPHPISGYKNARVARVVTRGGPSASRKRMAGPGGLYKNLIK